MLSWLLRGRNKPRRERLPRPNRSRLAVEALESRYCPSGPQVTAFSANVVQGQTVLLTGTVSDPGAGSVSVNFQGAASGTTTVANGSFFDGGSGGVDLPALTATGTYTIVLDPSLAQSMSASVSLVTR